MLTDSDTYVPCPSLEEDLHKIGCKTITIETNIAKIVIIDIGDALSQVVRSD